jgi:hypothetical protein
MLDLCWSVIDQGWSKVDLQSTDTYVHWYENNLINMGLIVDL